MNKTIEKRQAKEKQLLLSQLKKTPIIHLACERTGIGRASFYRWKKDDPIFAKQAEEALGEGIALMNDLAESRLLSSVKDGNLTGILFWLRNRHDAYKARVEISSAQKEEIILTDEQEEIIKKAIGLAKIEDRKEDE